jgi:hypothetical protein
MPGDASSVYTLSVAASGSAGRCRGRRRRACDRELRGGLSGGCAASSGSVVSGTTTAVRTGDRDRRGAGCLSDNKCYECAIDATCVAPTCLPSNTDIDTLYNHIQSETTNRNNHNRISPSTRLHSMHSSTQCIPATMRKRNE